ncbi:hypothetical protein EVAR_78511_1 [Eumeta japonica]|uniref:Uncharacterized protein n=1 Tax=Eumeta variegata TaxID=151549 RepID=A0A4C1TYA6_EUMVA|nr:hypothetical protein EVAR_78511_1 [Eumeta japonica]
MSTMCVRTGRYEPSILDNFRGQWVDASMCGYSYRINMNIHIYRGNRPDWTRFEVRTAYIRFIPLDYFHFQNRKATTQTMDKSIIAAQFLWALLTAVAKAVVHKAVFTDVPKCISRFLLQSALRFAVALRRPDFDIAPDNFDNLHWLTEHSTASARPGKRRGKYWVYLLFRFAGSFYYANAVIAFITSGRHVPLQRLMFKNNTTPAPPVTAAAGGCNQDVDMRRRRYGVNVS